MVFYKNTQYDLEEVDGADRIQPDIAGTPIRSSGPRYENEIII